MHQALEVKIHDLIEEGDEHKVQWGKLLETFSGLDLNRIVLALESLNPNQLDSISDGIGKARDKARTRSLESIRASILKEGVQISEFLEHLGVSVTDDIAKKIDRPKVAKNQTRRQLTPEGKKVLEDILISGKYSANQAVAKLLSQTGETASSATAYALKAKLKKAGKIA